MVGLGIIFFKSSLYLAASRIYHVDECQNVFMARILATGQAENYFTIVSLPLVPLMWLAGGASQSTELFASARLVSLMIFWFNLVLIALATGEKLLSRRGLIALAGAITLAPLWDFGFEIRPENLLLTELLLTWCVVRLGSARLASCLVVGALAMVMQFTSGNAFVYVVPLTLGILLFPNGGGLPRWKLVMAWVVGAFGMFIAIRVAYGAMGLWGVYLAGSPWKSGAVTGEGQFEPWKILGRLVNQSPLLSTSLAAASAALALECRRRGRSVFSGVSYLPEALVFFWILVVVLLNSPSRPYSLVILVPFAYLFAYRYVLAEWNQFWELRLLRPLIFTLLIFAHLVPFLAATRRHLASPNHRQDNLMRLAEELTGPADAVYDGIGMVPTRSSVHFHWLLRKPSLQGPAETPVPHVRDMLAARPAAVIIRSYRSDWMEEADHQFIRDRYVPLSGDIFVLGKMLPSGGGQFEVVHPGRYHIAPAEESNVEGTYEITLETMRNPPPPVSFTASLDGAPLTNRTMELAVGTHQIKTTLDRRPTVVWAGPRAKQARRVGGADHRRLFVNNY